MKRTFRNDKADGTAEIATVSLEVEAVTVARRDEASTSKGRPIRIPLARCQGKSVEQEARAQQLKLQAEGFVFVKAEGNPLEQAEDKFLYLVVRRQFIAEVIDLITGCEMPAGISVGSYQGGCVVVSDSEGQEVAFRLTADTSAVLQAFSPFGALALLLKSKGLANLVFEKDTGPAGSEDVSLGLLYSLAIGQKSHLSSFLVENGITSPGAIAVRKESQAVLL